MEKNSNCAIIYTPSDNKNVAPDSDRLNQFQIIIREMTRLCNHTDCLYHNFIHEMDVNYCYNCGIILDDYKKDKELIIAELKSKKENEVV
jgi:hypothetical protein